MYGQTVHKEQLFSGAANAKKLSEGQDNKAGQIQYTLFDFIQRTV